MNPATWRDAKKLFEATKKAAEKAKHVSLVVCPPALYLRDLKKLSKSRRIAFGVQHAHDAENGAHTGELSMAEIADSGASFVIIGHAERRERGETNDDTGKKIAAALLHKITPVFCVGEKERTQSGEHFNVVRDQLRAGFFNLQPQQVKNVIVVYEPLWTIGKDVTMSPRDMHEMAIFIRKSVVDWHGEGGMNLRVLYGGSVDAENAGVMLRDGDVAGLLVGRASEEPNRIATLLSAIEAA
jgi:triosephosphate isomerase